MHNNEQVINELVDRNKKATEQAIQINTKIETARETYNKLSLLAKEKFGTSDVNELKTLLESIKKENEEKLVKFTKEVEELEKEVSEKQELIKQIQQS